MSKAKKIARKLKPKNEKHLDPSKAVKNDTIEQPDKSKIKVYETQKEVKKHGKKQIKKSKKGTKKGTKTEISNRQKGSTPPIPRKKRGDGIRLTFWEW